ncbi:MAG TPA: restriction endonuclease subunit S [Terriglobia bacterium]|nr:restriction endonuclease subunit S [Terriglobia bacterium]
MSTTTPSKTTAEVSTDEESDLPEGWVEIELSDHIYIAGRIGWRGLKAEEYTSSGPLLLSVPNLNRGHYVDFTEVNHVSEARYEESPEIQLQSGDTLLVKDGAGIGKVGYVGNLPDRATVNSSLLVVRPADVLLIGQYLSYFFKGPDFQQVALQRITGSATPHLFQKDIKQFRVLVPPLPEQKRIVAKIEGVSKQVNASRERLAKVPKVLKYFRQSVLAAACSGRLTEDWREQHQDVEPAHVLIEHIDEYRRKNSVRLRRNEEPEFDLSDMPELPESWVWTAMGRVADVRGGIQKQPKRAPKQNPYPYLRVANVLRDRLDLTEIHQMELFGGELETYRLSPGDLLIVEGNGSLAEIGRSALWGGDIHNCVHQNHIIRVRPLICSPQYLNYYWNSPLGIERVAEVAVTTAGLYSLSTKKVATLPIALAPLEEQHEIVRRVEALFKLADMIEKRVEAATKRADKLTHAILAKAFRGELVPTEAELARQEGRDYEPASVLLERIKADREKVDAAKTNGKRPRKAAKKKG